MIIAKATIWLLVAISTGGYNNGNVSVVDKFATKDSCQFTKMNLETLNSRAVFMCAPADNLVITGN